MAAYCRLGPPHTPIMKYMGSSTSSKNTKKRIRSWATNVPFMPVSSTSTRMRNAFGLCGSGKWSHEYTTHSTVMRIDRASSGSEMPSSPTW